MKNLLKHERMAFKILRHSPFGELLRMTEKVELVFRFFVVHLTVRLLRMTVEKWNCHSDSPKVRKNLLNMKEKF